MVLINEKKFACATCIKGHRVSGCTHTERPLFEIKKKGRPSTQCQFCKDKRKGNSVHNKCVCGDPATPQVILPETAAGSSSTGGSNTPTEEHDQYIETRKGHPGSSATFPNGLRDVHEMSAAAEALTGFGEDPMRSAERSVQRLLNPCSCKHTGICKCCEPKRPARNGAKGHSDPHSVSSASGSSSRHTEDLVEMLKSRAPLRSTGSGPPSPSRHSPISPPAHPAMTSRHSFSQFLPVPDISPENPHHPAHTSKHVHKTKLYSPYSHSAQSRHVKRDSSSRQSLGSSGAPGQATSPRPQLPPIQPLGDMPTFLSAIFQADGSLSTEISRQSLGLPGIHTFDRVADQGGVKSEPMDWEVSETFTPSVGVDDVDMPLAFPTSEDVNIGACTCGEDCRCPGCVTHPNRAGTSSSEGGATTCEGSGCKSCFDCTDHMYIPAGMTSIEHLLATAAANVPKPSRSRPADLQAMDTTVLPPVATFSPDAAASLGFVQLKPLECCNGRCQCKPGECVCEKDCCGCCTRCACGEDAPTPTASTPFPPDSATANGGCCSAAREPVLFVPEKGSCCETGNRASSSTPRLSLSTSADTLAPPGVSPTRQNPSPPRLSPAPAGGFTFNPSPGHSPLLGPNHPPSLAVGASSHHSPLLSSESPGLQVNTSRHPSPTLSASGRQTVFNFDNFQLPSPGIPSAPSEPGAHGFTLPPPPYGQGTDDPVALYLDTSLQQGGAAPPLRRTSSTSTGHTHTQSTSSLANRRATVTVADTVGANIQRSASTGKQVSKALALNQAPNHTHVRPIAPRPTHASTSNAAHLAPPKSGRRRSSSAAQHSRASSPGPTEMHNRSASGSHALHGDVSQHRSQGSVDYSDFDPATAPVHVADQPLPMVTTSAPGETSQQVSFDPGHSAIDDPVLAALLEQLASDSGFAEQIQQGVGQSGMNIEPGRVGAMVPDSGLFDPSFGFGAFGSTGLSPTQQQQQHTQQHPTQNPVLPQESPGSSGVPQFDLYQLLAQSMGHTPAVSAGFENSTGLGSSVERNSMPQGAMPSQVPIPPQAWYPGMPVPYYPGYSQNSVGNVAQWTQNNFAHQTQSPAIQSQASAPMHSQPVDPSNTRTGPISGFNPNLIDLSKPLSAEHLQRIIQALQEQQEQQVAAASGPVGSNNTQRAPQQIPPPPPPVVNSMPPPPLPAHVGSRRTSNSHASQPVQPTFSFDQFALPHPGTSLFGISPTDTRRSHQPSFSASSFESFLAPPPSDSSGSASGSSHSTMLSGDSALTFEADGDDLDVFEKFIKDHPGEGLDLSVLDLSHGISGQDPSGINGNLDKGGAGSRMGTEADLSLGLGLGLGADDWVWAAETGH